MMYAYKCRFKTEGSDGCSKVACGVNFFDSVLKNNPIKTALPERSLEGGRGGGG